MAGNGATIKVSASGFFSILTLIFITLKLTGHIEWSWLWVLAPMWISAILVILLLIIVLALFFIDEHNKRKKNYLGYYR